MVTATQFRIPPDAEKALILYAGKANESLLNAFSLRSHLEQIDRYYMREDDFTEEELRARNANRRGDKSKMQNITVPIVMPQVEAAHGYMANVFLTGYPTFGVTSDPATEDAALQIETIIAENSITAGWTRQLSMFFRDGLKYNFHGVECDWTQRTTAAIETDLKFPNSAKPKSVVWKGNELKRMDLYNTFFDYRVHPAEIHSKGEFAGYTELYTRVRMKELVNNLYGTVPASVAIRAFQSQLGGGTPGQVSPFAYYMPIINPSALMDRSTATFDWWSWVQAATGSKSKSIRYTNVYEVMKLYARIIPADFGLKVAEENIPQVWKFLIVNGQVILYAERLSNAHGFIPIFFGQPIEDGLDFQTKSFATNVTDMQDIASSMWNGYIASKRRLVGDRVLYDPLRIREKDINASNPAAKIPVRPSAYGKTVSDAVYQFPFHDEQTQSFLTGSDMVVKFANLINRQNPSQQGQFVKGNKTKKEYDDTMGHGNAGNQVMALTTENQVFVPLKEAIKLNILQYQSNDLLFNREKNQQVQIKVEELRKAAVHFKVSDGVLPKEKLMDGEDWQAAMQVVGSSPQIQAGYQIEPMFSYLMKQRGVDLTPFKSDPAAVAYSQALQMWTAKAVEIAQSHEDPDALKKILDMVLGPKPTPPKQQQAPAAEPQNAAEGVVG
jgi:hypothetical protein